MAIFPMMVLINHSIEHFDIFSNLKKLKIDFYLMNDKAYTHLLV